MQPTPDIIDVIMACTRAGLLVICALAGVLCIYLGWRLYINAISITTNGELSAPGFKLKVASGGPGVFMAGLGIWLLLSVANRPLEISETAKQHGATPTNFRLVATQQTASKQCFLYIKTRKFDTGASDVTPLEIEQAATSAANGILRAKSAGIEDPEQRSETIRILYRLANIVRESDENP